MALPDDPLHVFNFHVSFTRVALPGADGGSGSAVPVCSGAFAECSGLEATMEPKVIKAGGMNYGAAQRVGPVTFATVVLKRGMTATRELWQWFALVAQRSSPYSGSGGLVAPSAYRLDAHIEVRDRAGQPALAWRLARALPVKFKAADLNARGNEVGIEELHLAHEGLFMVAPSAGQGDAS